MKRLIALALGATVLAGCSGDTADKRDNAGQREAEGEVLGGSISDEMIPIETIRSQSRSLRVAPKPDEAEEEVSDSGEDGSPAAIPEPEPQSAEPVDPATGSDLD